jgi:hypothetical protein
MSQFARTTAVFAALAALAAPLAAHAQSSAAPVTRAQVNAELVQVEQAGYDPHKISAHYPADIQAVQGTVQATTPNAAESGYGTVSDGSVASGSRLSADAQHNLFGHH